MNAEQAFRWVHNFNQAHREMIKLEEVLKFLTNSSGEFTRIENKTSELKHSQDVAKEELDGLNQQVVNTRVENASQLKELENQMIRDEQEASVECKKAQEKLEVANRELEAKKVEFVKLTNEKQLEIRRFDELIGDREKVLGSLRADVRKRKEQVLELEE